MKSVAWKGDHPITSYYGWRTSPITGARSFHDGVDVSMPVGTELYSPVSGKIRLAKSDSYGGKYIQVLASDGKGHWCLHLSEFKVKVGDLVQQGQLIGISGNTGQSTGPHTHFGLQSNAAVWDSHIDPLPSLQAQPTERFKRGDSIVFTDIQNIRKGSGTSYDITGQSVIGSTYEIEDGPRFADGYAWYDLKNNNWVADVGKFQAYIPPIQPPTDEASDLREEVNRLLEVNRGLSVALGASEDLLKVRDGQLSEARGRINLLEAEIEEAKNDYANLEENYTKVLEAKDRIEQEKLAAQEELDRLKQSSDWVKRIAELLSNLFNRK
jgi:septal ring factor EnvC (AmiA/AmiB activator)